VSVAVSGQGDVSQFTGQRRIRKVDYTAPQIQARVTFENHDAQAEARNLQFADDVTFHEDAWLGRGDCLLKLCHLTGLESVRVGEDVACVGERENAESEEKVESPAE
jgi:hypothetical protein